VGWYYRKGGWYHRRSRSGDDDAAGIVFLLILVALAAFLAIFVFLAVIATIAVLGFWVYFEVLWLRMQRRRPDSIDASLHSRLCRIEARRAGIADDLRRIYVDIGRVSEPVIAEGRERGAIQRRDGRFNARTTVGREFNERLSEAEARFAPAMKEARDELDSLHAELIDILEAWKDGQKQWVAAVAASARG
jgi:hypothetical protein